MHRSKRIREWKKFYAEYKKKICQKRKCRYTLREPKNKLKQMYIDKLHDQLLADPKTKSKVMKAFKSHPLADKVPNASCDTVCRLAAQKLSQLTTNLEESK